MGHLPVQPAARGVACQNRRSPFAALQNRRALPQIELAIPQHRPMAARAIGRQDLRSLRAQLRRIEPLRRQTGRSEYNNETGSKEKHNLADIVSSSKTRLVSLDAFRGATIASMILVNNNGAGNTTFAPLLHADWHGWTFTDLVFPFFLWMVGVSMTFSFARRAEEGADKVRL